LGNGFGEGPNANAIVLNDAKTPIQSSRPVSVDTANALSVIGSVHRASSQTTTHVGWETGVESEFSGICYDSAWN